MGRLLLCLAGLGACNYPTLEPPAGSDDDVRSFTSIAQGVYSTCGVTDEGAVACWGQTEGLVPELMHVRTLAMGFYRYFALNEDGTVARWTEEERPSLISGVTGAKALTEACFITAQDTVRCWSDPTVDVPGLSAVTALASGIGHSCAVMAGAVKCWGANESGQLGTGSTSRSATPVDVGLSGVVSISAWHQTTCAVLADHTLWCWGRAVSVGPAGAPVSELKPVPVPGLDNVAAVSVGYLQSCAVLTNGRVRCWGEDGTLGDGKMRPWPELVPSTYSTPVEVVGLDNAIGVSTGLSRTCALTASHTARCWGFAPLGRNTVTDHVAPTIEPELMGATGFTQYCVLAARGTVACGQGPTVAVPGITGATALAAGVSHACVIAADATVRCWGDNSSNQLGNGTTDASAAPMEVPGLAGIRGIAAQYAVTCVITGQRTVQCWGVDLPAPTEVVGLSDITAISAARGGLALNGYFCALTAAGGVKCWGSNLAGQLGNNSTVDSSTPVDVVGLTGARAIATGGQHACAVTAAKSVVCWGDNTEGQLGDGTLTGALAPVAVTGLTDVEAIALGQTHSCALTAGGGAWCWGANSRGQLGIGSVTRSTSPVRPLDVDPVDTVFAAGSATYFQRGTTIRSAGNHWAMYPVPAGEILASP